MTDTSSSTATGKTTAAAATAPATATVVIGRLVKKRKYPGPYISLAVKVKETYSIDTTCHRLLDEKNGLYGAAGAAAGGDGGATVEVKNDNDDGDGDGEHEQREQHGRSKRYDHNDKTTPVVATTQQRQQPMLIFVPKTDPGLKFCHVDSWVQVEIVSEREEEEKDGNVDNINSNSNKDGRTKNSSTGREGGRQKENDSTTGTATAAAVTESRSSTPSSSSSSNPTRTTFVNSKHTLATNLRLVKCAPNPSVVPDILQCIKHNEIPFNVVSDYCPSLQHEWQIDEVLSLRPTDRDRKRLINEICQQLLRMDDKYQEDRPNITEYGSGVSARNTHIKKRYWDILTKMESIVQLVDVATVVDDDDDEDERGGRNKKQENDQKEQNQDIDTDNNKITSHIEKGKASSSKEVRSSSSSLCKGDDGGEENEDKDGTSHRPMIYNIPGNDLTLKSFRHPRSRYEYLQDKKWPQINWLLRRMRRLSKFSVSSSVRNDNAADSPGQPTVVSVLDVGGGRGDIACAIAKEFPHAKVTVVDENQTSLDAGRKYADEVLGGVREAKERIDFVCADFRLFAKEYVENYHNQQKKTNNMSDTRRSSFDFVVAWHACGDLSDIALQFSNDISASFVICPCCYTKERLEGFTPSWIGNYLQGDGDGDEDEEDSTKVCHEIIPTDGTSAQDVWGAVGNNGNHKTPALKKKSSSSLSRRREEIDAIQKLAETNDRPEISRRAMTVINSMRLHALSSSSPSSSSDNSGRDKRVLLESYPLNYSSKNLVLVKES